MQHLHMHGTHPLRKNSSRMSRSQGRHSASPPSTITTRSFGSSVLQATIWTPISTFSLALYLILKLRPTFASSEASALPAVPVGSMAGSRDCSATFPSNLKC